jgi:hypothetical protein
MIFWVVMFCILVKAQHFGATCHLCLSGWRVSQARNQQEQAGFCCFLCLVSFYHELQGNMFLKYKVLPKLHGFTTQKITPFLLYET